MKRGLTLLAVTAILFGMSMQAQATPISLTPTAPSPVLKGNDTSQSAISAIIEGACAGLQEFYKAERNPPDELGPAALWYKATWGVPAPQGSATISWEGPGWISASRPEACSKRSPPHGILRAGGATCHEIPTLDSIRPPARRWLRRPWRAARRAPRTILSAETPNSRRATWMPPFWNSGTRWPRMRCSRRRA